MPNTDKIRALNDAFRKTLLGGRVLLSAAVSQRSDIPEIIERVRTFDDFHEGNDPWCEHDFGAFKIEQQQMFFKVDYYDADLNGGSPDPSDPAVTQRVMTIMLAEEY